MSIIWEYWGICVNPALTDLVFGDTTKARYSISYVQWIHSQDGLSLGIISLKKEKAPGPVSRARGNPGMGRLSDLPGSSSPGLDNSRVYAVFGL